MSEKKTSVMDRYLSAARDTYPKEVKSVLGIILIILASLLAMTPVVAKVIGLFMS